MPSCSTARTALATYQCVKARGLPQLLYQTCSFSSNACWRSEPDYEAARRWHANFTQASLLKIGDVTYSRSSGPGGQNVNKVNTKAQLKVPIDALIPLVPPVLHGSLKSSRYYAEKSSSLVFQSDESRKQAANKDICYRRLNDLIMEVYQKVVPGETSPEQQEKVKKLKKAENESRLKLKKYLSSKKAARRGDD